MHRGRRVLGFSHGREGGGSWGLRNGSFSIIVVVWVVGCVKSLFFAGGAIWTVLCCGHTAREAEEAQDTKSKTLELSKQKACIMSMKSHNPCRGISISLFHIGGVEKDLSPH